MISKDYRPMPGQQFRQGKSTLIPFVEIILDVMRKGAERVTQQTSLIDEVVVGPTPTPGLIIQAVEALFVSGGTSKGDCQGF